MCSRNPIVTSWITLVARFQNLISLAQPSCHFVSVSSLSLWRGANLDIARNLLVTSCALDSSRGVVLSF